MPSNAWETFFLAASAGDAKGMWWALSPAAFKLSAGLAALSFAVGLARGGEGLLPGPGLAACGLVAAACLATEVAKFSGGMQGGDTGTGGRF